MKKQYKQFSNIAIPVLLKNGWIETTSQGHRKFLCLKTNKTIMFSCSPSDGNAHRATFRNIRKNDPKVADILVNLGLY